MLIEVTEKEAKGIYSQRYIDGDKYFMYKCLPSLLIALPAGLCLDTFTSITGWLAVGVVAIIVAPAVYLSLRLSFASKKYAKKQIEEIG